MDPENQQQQQQQQQENQEQPKSLIDTEELAQILKKQFPPLELVIGYGSGVFAQLSYDYSVQKPMVDLIFVVDNIEAFHEENLKINPTHYSGLGKIFGASYLTFLQTHVLPIHFNPMIKINDDLQIKYGVIEKRKFIRDLKNWDTLICAGRLHKPVKIILDNDATDSFNEAFTQNLISATSVSLLLNYDDLAATQQNVTVTKKKSKAAIAQELKQQEQNKPKFANPFANLSKTTQVEEEETEIVQYSPMNIRQFYFTLASLSYVGDVRYKLGAENANKIENIIEGNKLNFDSLYGHIFGLAPLNTIIQESEKYEDEIDIYAGNDKNIETLIDLIPVRLATEFTGVEKDCYESLKKIKPTDVQKALSQALHKKNAFYSKRMLLYNFLSTSPAKNAVYALQKLKKGILKR